MADLNNALARLATVVAEVNGKQNIAAKIKANLAGAEAEVKTHTAAVLRNNSAKDQDVDSAKQEVAKLKEEVKKSLLRKNAGAGNDDQDDNDDNDAAFMLADVDTYNTLTATVDSLQTEVSSLQTKVSTLEDSNKKLKNAMHHKDVETRAAKADVKKTKKDLSSSKDQLVDKGYEHEIDLQDTAQKLRDEKALVGRLQQSGRVQEARIIELDIDLRKSKQDLAAVRGTVEIRERTIQYWRDQLPAKETKIKELKKEKAEADEKHKTTVDDLEERRTKLVAEKGRLAEESEETIGTLKGELDLVKAEKVKLEEAVKKAKEELQSKKAENKMLWKKAAEKVVRDDDDSDNDEEGQASKRPRFEGVVQG